MPLRIVVTNPACNLVLKHELEYMDLQPSHLRNQHTYHAAERMTNTAES